MTELKKNICLVHGWGANAAKLIPLKEELGKLGWNVFLVLIPFFELKAPRKPWNLKDFADFIDKKSRSFFKKESYCLFGYSFGGRIGIKMASENFPKLNSLVLCSAAGISRINPIRRFFFKLLVTFFSPFKKPLESQLPYFKKIIYRLARAFDYEKIKSKIKKETFKRIIEESLRLQAEKAKIPTLIVWGGKDKTTPVKDAYFLKNKITNSTLEIFPKENHQLPYHKPKKIAKKIDLWFKKL